MTTWYDLCPPVLTCAEAHAFEKRLFGGDEAREWAAMQQAGAAIAEAVRRDAMEMGGLPENARILVLVGKGHNGGDALIAANQLLEVCGKATVDVVFAFGERALRPLAARAWRDVVQRGGDRIRVQPGPRASGSAPRDGGSYDLCLDGVFGFQFRPPVEPRVVELIERANAASIRLRAAVDLPSADRFRADFTYATGSVKAPLLESKVAGRIRYLDLGFFAAAGTVEPAPRPTRPTAPGDRVLTPALLEPLRQLRSPNTDKRHYGHVFLLGGSRHYPGAILMAAMGAVQSDAGLTTVFVPESLAAPFAARLPEAMWVGWPETPEGSLALEGEHLLRERMSRADAIVIGPGLGREPETLALAENVVRTSPVPLVIDADALQPGIVRAGEAPRIVTPHAGEFARIAAGTVARDFAADRKLTLVLKGPVTRVYAGAEVYHAFCGGPVLARGGSGDVLAGMMGTLLAQSPANPGLAASRAVVWHGIAADLLARTHGHTAIRTTQLLDHLSPALGSIRSV